jgi:cyclopropane fatty-acyl-phospholipid synthase-like methyltransferase
MRPQASLPSAYFEALYQERPDPWAFETSPYEAAKYDHTLEVLGQEVFANALEVGCSIGVLTARLATRCRTLTATDVSETALSQAKRRCATLGNIRFIKVSPPRAGVEGPFDLVVLSEVLYYWSALDLAEFAGEIAAELSPGARLLLVHWLGETDYPLEADAAVEIFGAGLGRSFQVVTADRREKYRLDLWRTLDP